eukprot:5536207-Amphidinium_carterae.1
MLWSLVARAIAVDFVDASWECFPTALFGHNAVRLIFKVLQCLCLACIHGGLTCIVLAFAWDDFSASMSLAVTCCLSLPLFFEVVAIVDSEGNAIYDLRPLVYASRKLLIINMKGKGYDAATLKFAGMLFAMTPKFCVSIAMNPGLVGRAEVLDNLAA